MESVRRLIACYRNLKEFRVFNMDLKEMMVNAGAAGNDGSDGAAGVKGDAGAQLNT